MPIQVSIFADCSDPRSCLLGRKSMRWGVNSLVVTLHIPTAQRDDGLICSVPNTQHHQQQAMPMRTRHGTMNLLIAQSLLP